MLSFLNGKKTYLVAIGGILSALGGVLSGAIDPVTGIKLAFDAVLAMTIRHGIANS